MKQHPILFSGTMVRALLEHRKTQTRRLSKRWLRVKEGDRLWVREATESYFLPNFLTGEPTNAVCGRYSIDKEPVLDPHGFDLVWWCNRPVCPSILMPRCASRITLEATEDAREERLQDITEDEAIAEGAPDTFSREKCPGFIDNMRYTATFASLWEDLHTKPGERWAENPVIVRIAFRVVDVRS